MGIKSDDQDLHANKVCLKIGDPFFGCSRAKGTQPPGFRIGAAIGLREPPTSRAMGDAILAQRHGTRNSELKLAQHWGVFPGS